MFQRTIKNSIEIVGIGLHKGVPISMKLEPLDVDSGIVFYRKDLGISIPLSAKNVVDTNLATVIERDGARISTIEHLCSALYSYGIDNILITVDNEEIPILDGSSVGFCMLLDEAMIEEQKSPKKVMLLKKRVEVRDGDRYVSLEPSSRAIFDFTIEFDHPIIRKQEFSFEFSTLGYKSEIAKARTFGFLEEVQYLRSKNLALGGSLQNAIVLDKKRVLNSDGLRYKDEFVRHKILDAIGDISLLGVAVLGRYSSFAGSHALNFKLTSEILSSSDCYEIVELKAKDRLAKELLKSYVKA